MQLGEWFGLGSLIVGLPGLYFYKHNQIKDYLKEPEYRENRIEELRQPDALVLYHKWLTKGLAWVAGIWGEERWHAKSFLTCFFFSFLYSMSLFFISWVLGGTGKIGALQFLPPDLIEGQRWVVLFGGGAYLLAMWKVSNLRVNYFLKVFLLSGAIALAGTGALSLSVVVAGFIAAATAIVFVVAFSAAKIGVITVSIVTSVSISLPLTSNIYMVVAMTCFFFFFLMGYKSLEDEKTWASVLMFIMLLVLSIVNGLILVSYSAQSVVFVSFYLFLFALPLVNSLLDGVSMGVSRWMVEQLGRDRNIKKIFWHIVADFFIALILLLALTVTLVGGVEAFNQLAVLNGHGAPLALTSLLNQAQASPWAPESLWITLMLLSTLLPTFAHLVVAWAGLFTSWLSDVRFQGYIKNLEDYGLAIERGVTEKPISLLHNPARYFTLRWPLAVVANMIFFWCLFTLFEVAGAPLSDGLYMIADETINIVRSFF